MNKVISSVALALSTVFLAYVLFFHHLDRRDLWSSHEARAAQNAQTILDTGQWALPRLFDGRVELQKPPLYYWLVAVVAWLQGGPVDAWAVRLPAALAAVGGMLGLFILAWCRGRPWAGLLAALMLGTMLHYTWLARVGRIDMPLTLAVGTALTGFYLGDQCLREGRPRTARCWLLGGYLSLAVAILLKGPIGLVLEVLVMLTYLGSEGQRAKASRGGWQPPENPSGSVLPRRTWLRLGWWWGLPLVLLLTAPWFLWAHQQTGGEFGRVFFYQHNFQRGLGGNAELDGHAHPWWFYGCRLWIDLAPWSLLLPVAGYGLSCCSGWRADAEARFGTIWLVVILVFLSGMRFKRADYLLPAYPGAALLLGCLAERWFKAATANLRFRSRKFGYGLLAATVAVCTIGWLIYVDLVLPQEEATRTYQPFAAEVRRRVPRGVVLLFRTEAHALVYHLGKPVDRIWEWENLDIWASRSAPVYVVMPPEWAQRWPQYLEAGQLYPVISTDDLAGAAHDEPLVLLCTRPVPPSMVSETRGFSDAFFRASPGPPARSSTDRQGLPGERGVLTP